MGRAVDRDDVVGLQRRCCARWPRRSVPSSSWKSRPPPHAPPTSSNRLLRDARCAWSRSLGWLSSRPRMLTPAADVAHDVVHEGDVLDDRPRRAAVLVAHGEQDREAVLRVRPVVLEQVALDEHAARVLQLEQVLDGPRRARVGRVAHLPGQRLREVVAPDLDVGGHQPGDRRDRRRRTSRSRPRLRGSCSRS